MYHGLIDLDRVSKALLGFLEEKRKASMYLYTLWSSLQIFESDSKLFHLDQESERLDIYLSIIIIIIIIIINMPAK